MKLPGVAGSVRLDVGGLYDRRPASNLTLHKGGERLLSAAPACLEFPCRGRAAACAKLSSSSALSSASVSLSRIGFGVPLGSKQGEPDPDTSNSGSSPSFAVGTFGRIGTAMLRSDRICLDRAAPHVWYGIKDSPVAHVVDLAADQSVHGRGEAIEGYRRRLRANNRIETISPQLNPIEPTPACAMFSFWSFAFTYATKSLRSLAGKSFLATIMTGAEMAKPIGAKSISGL